MLFFVAGFAMDVAVLGEWISRSLGAIDAVRPALFAMTFIVLGIQMLFASFFLSIFRIKVHAIKTHDGSENVAVSTAS